MNDTRILSIGQCGADHGAIAWFVRDAFPDVAVDPAATEVDAVAALTRRSYALILVNRVLDFNHARGIDIIRRLKADSRFAEIPVMLVSNYADAQRDAEAAGALPGFGKSNLDNEGRTRLAAALARSGDTSSYR